MKKLVNVIIAFTMVCFTASGAFAWDLIRDGEIDDGTGAATTEVNGVDGHVTQAPNHKGDVLIYPFYMAADGWETKIQVMNTSLNRSAVAKLVVRSFKYSQEVRDFFIYLTPSDVWTGTLRNVDGTVRMQSCDDSTRNINGEWGDASAEPPVCMDIPLYNQGLCAGDGDFAGYVEIFMAWHSDPYWANAVYPGTADNVRWPYGSVYPNGYAYPTFAPGPINKQLLYDWFMAGPMHNDGPYANLTSTDIVEQINGEQQGVIIPPPSILAGHLELINDSLNVRAPVLATALRNYNVDTYLRISQETRFSHDNSTNTICEVEAALAKNNISVPYYNMPGEKQTYYWITFPTKLSRPQSCLCSGPNVTRQTADSPYFNYYCTQAKYGLKYFDLTEQTVSGPTIEFSPPPAQEIATFPDEVNLLPVTASDFIYDEGWINITDNKGANTTCNPEDHLGAVPERIEFAGMPVIPTTMFFDFYTKDDCTENCAASYGISFMPAAYDQAQVLYDRGDGLGRLDVPYYHFEDREITAP